MILRAPPRPPTLAESAWASGMRSLKTLDVESILVLIVLQYISAKVESLENLWCTTPKDPVALMPLLKE